MKTLNLAHSDKSDIKYKPIEFPDGQQNIVITNYDFIKNSLSYGRGLMPIQIKSRLNNWLDLELITCAVASLRELGVEEIHLHTPYIIGARSDRKFEEGGNNYIKDVLAPIINSLNFKTVTCIDPHSDVLEACIKGFRKESNLELVKYSISEMYNIDRGEISDDFILVSPDAGASKKIYKLAEQIGYEGDIITCSKDRDKDGKLTKTVVPEPKPTSTLEYYKKDKIIIDDICDGGATFINIAKIIKDFHIDYKKYLDEESGKIYLIVTHGIFSKGVDELFQYFDGIYCTNSYQSLEKVKQLYVF